MMASAAWLPTAARLRARLARPQLASGDWSIELLAGGRTCDLCDTLRVFLEDPNRRAFEWPLAKQGRQHVHSRIDTAELPVSHVTRWQVTTRYLRGLGDTNILIYLERLAVDQLPAELITSTVSLAELSAGGAFGRGRR